MQANDKKLAKLVVRLMAWFFAALVAFGLIFLLIGSLGGGGITKNGAPVSFFDHLYFSAVTIATLGYGDLVPAGYSKIVASAEAVFGLIYCGYAISQVVSFRQSVLVNYLASSNIIQTFDVCLSDLAEAKEKIGDRRRSIQARLPIDETEFIFFQLNPFYPAFRSIKTLFGYCAHVESIGMTDELVGKFELAAHHIEEVAGFTRKLINVLNSEKAEWKTDRSVMVLTEMCELISQFEQRFLKYTVYDSMPYKGDQMYTEVVSALTKNILSNTSGPRVKYRPSGSKSLKVNRSSRVGTMNPFDV